MALVALTVAVFAALAAGVAYAEMLRLRRVVEERDDG